MRLTCILPRRSSKPPLAFDMSTKSTSSNTSSGSSAGSTKKSATASDASDLKHWYRQMFLIRRFEEEAARAYSQGKIGGFLHLYIGQEAIAVGAVAALRHEDYMLTTYRDHGLALARGMSPNACMAELFGKDTGCSRGLGGSMHMFDVANHFYGGHAIVGGHTALAAGMAFKSKYVGEDRVTVCFFGEGATNIGGFHEALSLASLWKLPCVFVCENNEYAMGTPVSRGLPVADVTKKAAGYGMPSDRLQGHDVFEVKAAIEKAAARARDKGGPTLVEIMTYRFRGHSMSDPGKYRTAEELEDRKRSRDPIAHTRTLLAQAKVSERDIKAIEESVEQEVQHSVEFANASEPAVDSSIHAFTYVETAS
jgi:pyruvate dehydrogenase E1 component alpha subunit